MHQRKAANTPDKEEVKEESLFFPCAYNQTLIFPVGSPTSIQNNQFHEQFVFFPNSICFRGIWDIPGMRKAHVHGDEGNHQSFILRLLVRTGRDCWQLYWWLTQQVLDLVIPTGALCGSATITVNLFKVLCHPSDFNKTNSVIIDFLAVIIVSYLGEGLLEP